MKLLFLLMAGVNVAVFDTTIARSMSEWDLNPVPPLRARLAGGVSLVLWSGVLVAGRMIAYNWFDKSSDVSVLSFFTSCENSALGESIRPPDGSSRN